MIGKEKGHSSNIGISPCGKPMDFATALSTIANQDILLKKLRVEMDAVIENNIEFRVENDMLRLRTERQCTKYRTTEEEKEISSIQKYQEDEIKSLRVFVELLKHKIDKLRQEQKSWTEQQKNSFTPTQVDEMAFSLEREICEKEREATHWKNEVMRTKIYVSELESTLLQKDEDIMDMINETNALVQRKTNENKALLDNRFKIEEARSNCIPFGGSTLASVRSKSLQFLFESSKLNEQTSDSSTKHPEMVKSRNSATLDKYQKILSPSTPRDKGTAARDGPQKRDDTSLDINVGSMSSVNHDEFSTCPPGRSLAKNLLEISLRDVIKNGLIDPNLLNPQGDTTGLDTNAGNKSSDNYDEFSTCSQRRSLEKDLLGISLRDVITNGLIDPNLLNPSWSEVKLTESVNDKISNDHQYYPRLLPFFTGNANSRRATAA